MKRIFLILPILFILISCGENEASSRMLPEPDKAERLKYEQQQDSLKKTQQLNTNIPTH